MTHRANPNKRGGQVLPPILRAEIEEAQRHTNSNISAAKWLNVSYTRYKRYAKLYGLFDSHLNIAGVGIEKGFSKNPTSIPLNDILAGNHPDYSLAKLKNRLLARKKLDNKCSLCGFDEQRVTDGRVPLMLAFKDGNKKNFNLENLHLLCYNCMFLTTGAPSVVYRESMEKTLQHPERLKYHPDVLPTTADAYDPRGDDHLLHDEPLLTDEERNELLKELGH